MNFALLPIFLALGAFVGFLAGLLGIGGGFTIVPVLIEVFSHEGFATRAPACRWRSARRPARSCSRRSSSARAHHARGAVAWPVVRRDGAGARRRLAARAADRERAAGAGHGRHLRRLHLVRRVPDGAQPADRTPTRELPGSAGHVRHGRGDRARSRAWSAPAARSSPVPFMTRCNVKMHTAVATSAALGVPIAVAATIGYVLAGLAQDRPAAVLDRLRLPARAGRRSRSRARCSRRSARASRTRCRSRACATRSPRCSSCSARTCGGRR